MEQLQGLVEHIVYHNSENGYTVLNLMCQGDEVVCVGTMPVINEGEYIKAEGDYVEHATYGQQFKIDLFRGNTGGRLFCGALSGIRGDERVGPKWPTK